MVQIQEKDLQLKEEATKLDVLKLLFSGNDKESQKYPIALR